VKVKGHSGNTLNEEADHLAQEAAFEIEINTWSDQ
jgi:ribonuclease HI